MNRSHQTRATDTPDRQRQHSRGARLDLQAQAGNRAVAGLLQPRSVQRFGEAEDTDMNAVNPIVQGIEDVVGHLPFLGDLFGGDAKAGKRPAEKAPPAKPQPAPVHPPPPHPAPPAPVPMPYPTFGDIPGESTDDKHKDWIEILGYDHSMSTGP
jgi:hypothetical protein